MLNRYLIGLFLIFMQVAPALSNGQGYSTVSMPGFFNPNNLRYKQAHDAENGRVWIGAKDFGVLVWSNSTWTFWDQSNGSLPPGIYFVTLQTGHRFTTKKLIRN